MNDTFFKQINLRIIKSGRDPRYAIGAYGTVAAAFDFFRLRSGVQGHISAEQIVHALAELALAKYGPMAESVLSYMGITSPADIGNIVYNLIDIGIFSKQDDDSLDDFYACDSIFNDMDTQKVYRVDPKEIKMIKGA
ncbi:MAG: Minf_1886 family protein [Fibrobacterota bacterium]